VTVPDSGPGLGQPVLVGAAAALGLMAVNPSPDAASVCPSAVLFGVACPLCGLTRGTARLLRGDLDGSWFFHPMAGLVLLVLAGAWLAWMGRAAGWWSWRSRRVERWALGITLAGLSVTWAVRLALDSLPPL
jgi:hypothetical protein